MELTFRFCQHPKNSTKYGELSLRLRDPSWHQGRFGRSLLSYPGKTAVEAMPQTSLHQHLAKAIDTRNDTYAFTRLH